MKSSREIIKFFLKSLQSKNNWNSILLCEEIVKPLCLKVVKLFRHAWRAYGWRLCVGCPLDELYRSLTSQAAYKNIFYKPIKIVSNEARRRLVHSKNIEKKINHPASWLKWNWKYFFCNMIFTLPHSIVRKYLELSDFLQHFHGFQLDSTQTPSNKKN